jgi:hypothetical protein
MKRGGSADLTQGYRVEDIEDVMLSQSKGVPVFVKDIANVSVGHVPRLGKAGRDHDDDVVAAIVIMPLHTNDVVARVRAEIEKINHDGSLPPGLKLVPFYDRTTLISQQSYYRWRKEYGGLELDQAKRMKDLERENVRLKRLVADLSLEKQVLKDVA